MRLAQNLKLLLAACLFLSTLAPAASAQRRTQRTEQSAAARGVDVERKIEALLARMTLEEKLGQLQQLGGDIGGHANPDLYELARAGRLGSTLGIRGAKNSNDLQRAAVEGSRLKIPLIFGFDVIHGYRTIFPIPLGEAASFDPAAAERSAYVAAAEARAAGVHWTFAPMVDVARDARWGRISEGAGEGGAEKRIFTRALGDAAPTGIARDVDHRRKGPTQADVVCFLCCDSGGVFGERWIPATCLPQWDWEDRAVAVNHVETK